MSEPRRYFVRVLDEQMRATSCRCSLLVAILCLLAGLETLAAAPMLALSAKPVTESQKIVVTVANGRLTFDPASISAGARWRYGSGSYRFILAYDDGYRIEASAEYGVR